MICEDLTAFADGELNEARAGAFRRHLPFCQACHDGLAALLKTSATPSTAPRKRPITPSFGTTYPKWMRSAASQSGIPKVAEDPQEQTDPYGIPACTIVGSPIEPRAPAPLGKSLSKYLQRYPAKIDEAVVVDVEIDPIARRAEIHAAKKGNL